MTSKQEHGRYKNLFKTAMSLVVWSIMVLCWAWCWMSSYADEILRPFGYKGNWLVFAVYGVLMLIFTGFYGGYRIGSNKLEDVILSGILSMIIANGITYLQTCLVARGLVRVIPFLLLSLLQMLLILMWAHIAHRLYIKWFPPHNMLLIYGGSSLAESLARKMTSRWEKYRIEQTISIEEGIDAVIGKLSEFDAVVLCDVPAPIRNKLLKYCFSQSIRTYTTPKISDILIRGAVNISLFDTPLLLNRNIGLTDSQRFFKRLTDLVISSLMLVLASPFMLIIALSIKLYDRGPVLYKQQRLTINAKRFYVYKFRSMVTDAEKKTGAILSVKHDRRITPVGRLIRATRLDELPQLINIFKGEMSLVGPRPERPEIAEDYLKQMPEFSYRLKVKAGLTGYAQVVGRYNTTPYDKLKLDLMYIVDYNLLEDFKLLLMTAKTIFVKESTEGLSAKQGE